MDAGAPFDAGPDYDAGERPDAAEPPRDGGCACLDDSNPCTIDDCTGMCHRPAPTGQICGEHAQCDSAGSCVCEPDYERCGVLGVNCPIYLPTDAAHCGNCETTCPASCIAGACASCTPGSGDCADPDPCTVDSCPMSGVCMHAPTSGAACAGDGIDCTMDVCSSGSCTHPVMAGSCFIGGVCYADRTPNPANGCQLCNVAASTTMWSNADGSACNDGTFCNGNDGCSGGVCSTHSGPPCGTEICDEAMDRCIPCGGMGEICCPGREVDNTSTSMCCGADPGRVQQCCGNADCPVSVCPGGGDRWECVGGTCCFGACDGSC